jgi:hypothetical protein
MRRTARPGRPTDLRRIDLVTFITDRREGWRIVGIVCGLVLLAAFSFRVLLTPGIDGLPGRDAANLYVLEQFTRLALGAGQLPYWNPFQFAGTPHLADPQTLLFYPPAWLLRWLPELAFLRWFALIHVWIGGAGALVLGRIVGLGWVAATAAAITVMLGGSVGPWLHSGHLLQLSAAAWLPWGIALAIVSARRPTAWPHPFLVVVVAMQFLAGSPQSTIYTVAAVSLYLIFTAAWPEDRHAGASSLRPLGQLVMLGALAIGVTAFQLLPTLQFVSEAGRTAGLPYEEAVEGGWSLRHLATFFFPFLTTSPDSPHRFLPDSIAYAGWLMTAMVPMAFEDRSRRRIAVFFALLAGIAILFAIRDLPFYRLHYWLFPGLREPGRLLFLATLGIALLGAIGFERFVVLTRLRQWRALTPAILVSVAAILAATAVAITTEGAALTPMWPWLPVVAMTGVFAVGVLSARNRTRAAAVVASVLVIGDLGAFSAGAATIVAIEPAASLNRLMGPPQAGRGLSICDNRIGPGDMLENGQLALDGVASFFLDDYANWAYLARFGNPVPYDGQFHGLDTDGILPARRDLLDLANMSVVFSCRPLNAPRLTLMSRQESVFVYRNAAESPRAFWTCGGPRVTEAAATDQLVRSRYTTDGRLLPETYINVRWTRTVDDARRQAAEDRYRLAEGVRLDDLTWRYVLDDPSPSNVMAIVQDTSVEDTHGVDRGNGVILPRAPVADAAVAGDELVIGAVSCSDRGTVETRVQDRPDGLVVADVEAPAPGFVFLSEPHYPERRAFIDGQEVPSVTANVAFTAVPVPAGRYRLELRYVPTSFRLGLGVAVLTIVGWVAARRIQVAWS